METPVRETRQLGNVIRRVRRLKGLSQSDLGEKSGLRQATISVIETGKAAKLEPVLSILAALDLELHIAPRSISEPREIEELF
jgi:HTH-type transcriptional regulator/antitoxin HipB